MRNNLRIVFSALPLLLACAGAGSQVPIALSAPATPAPAEYTPTGEVIVRGRGVTFSDWRVVGPTVNLALNAEGSWAGSILGQSVILKPGPGRLSGSGGDLHFVRWEQYVYVRGMLGGRKVEVRYKPGPGHPTRGGSSATRPSPRSTARRR